MRRLFAEGGGQLADFGWINDKKVVNVQKKAGKIVHYMEVGPAELGFYEGNIVRVRVDWNARFDHMQQHSGQHLISAIAFTKFRWNTVSWKMNRFPEDCFVEFACKSIGDEALSELENEVNGRILDALNVQVHEFPSFDDIERKFGKDARFKRIPEDQISSGSTIRVIEISGQDLNMCCGTHVSNTRELQMIKFYGTQKNKGNTRLFFTAGKRTLEKLQNLVNLTNDLTKLLSAGQNDFIPVLKKLKSEQKENTKKNADLLKKLASVDSRQIAEKSSSHDTTLLIYREFADMTYLLKIAASLKDNDTKTSKNIILIGDGLVYINGLEEFITKASSTVSEILNAKGQKGGNGTPFRGKFEHSRNGISKDLIIQMGNKLDINYISFDIDNL